MPGQILKGCAKCGRGFKPRGARDRYCPACAPSVLRSPTTRERPGSREWERIRAEVLAGGPECAIRGAGCTGAATTVDHIIPVALGGTHERSNLRPACSTCNSTEGGRTAHLTRDDVLASPPSPSSPPRPVDPASRRLR